jgi:hypothetical protein
MRSTSVALLGITTATGLFLVAMALRQEFPFVGSSPLPTPPSLLGDAHNRSSSGRAAVGSRGNAVSASTTAPDLSHAAEGSTPTASAPPAPQVESPALGAGSPTGAKKADSKRPPHGAPPSSPVVTGTPTAAPAGQPSEGSSEPVSDPVPEPAPSHPGNGNAYGRGNGNGLGNGLGNGGVPPGHESGGRAATTWPISPD